MAVPRFRNEDSNHWHIADFSRQCYAAANQDNMDKLTELEAEIDKAAAKIWEITDVELKAILEALSEL